MQTVQPGENKIKLLPVLLAINIPCDTSCFQASACPATNKTPRPVVTAHKARKRRTSPRADRRRAHSRVPLLASNTAVLAHKIAGMCAGTQSAEFRAG